ncbi:MAG TPA: hypothetical protein VI702_02340 [Nitrospiria bacterium]
MSSPRDLVFIFALIVLIFYIPLLLILVRRVRQKIARRQFFHAVIAILHRVSDSDAVVEQIHIVFKKLAERFPYVSQTYKGATDFAEDLLYRAEAFREGEFKRLYGFELDNSQKDRIVQAIAIMKVNQPFSSISSKYGNLLNMIKHSFDTNNHDLGVNNLRQLADDIEVLESTLEVQARRNQVSIVVSIVGVVLTIVFGALSIVPYFTQTVAK